MRTLIVILISSLLGSAFPSPYFLSASPPIRVLILSGRNNHDWKTTTPKLQAILEETGRFKVDVTENPAALSASFLEPYDVILSNWNSFGDGQDAEAWPKDAKNAYIEFVRRGKGHVVVHAGGASFAGWDEYKRLTLATWKEGLTSHGPPHKFPVRIESVKHPVTAGLEPFEIKDELWNRPAIARGATILASSYSDPDKGGSGRWEPSVLVGRFDRGRTITILLGHDVEAMENPGFQALLRRGVEWAATGRVATGEAPRARSGLAWEVQDGKSLALLGPGGILWQFRFDPSLDVPYFHPLSTMDGRLLTWDAPPDHIWHHGLWFSWKFLNKVNYWEIDAKTSKPEGRTSWSDVKTTARDDFSARIDMALSYRPGGESEPVMTEKRAIEISRPDEAGAYSLDWTSAFTALQRVVLDRTPLANEPGGQTWGGYSGLSVRFAKGLAERKVMTSDGPIVEFSDNRYRGKHAAMDYSGLLSGHQAGIAICDHPDNPGFPTPWYAIVEPVMSFFNAAVICYGPITLEPGQKLTLGYRVLVHPGRFDAERLRAECDRFAATPAKTISP